MTRPETIHELRDELATLREAVWFVVQSAIRHGVCDEVAAAIAYAELVAGLKRDRVSRETSPVVAPGARARAPRA